MQTPLFIGIDVSKDEVMVAYADDSQTPHTLTNRRRELRAWLDRLPEHAQLALESTGRYHEEVLELAVARGLSVYLLNPRALHHYAKAVHRGAKTDRLDALLIARWLASEHHKLRPYRPRSPLVQQLLRLQRRRTTVVNSAKSLRLSLADLKGLDRPIKQVLKTIDALVAKIDHQIERLLRSNDQHHDLAQRLRSLPGFGPLNAAHHATWLPAIQPHSADAVVGYLGLDPKPRDSGRLRGKRKLTKHGPAESRRLAYLAAMAAARSNPDWNALHQRYRQRGRSAIEANVILARRLLRIAYSIYRYGGVYDPNRFKVDAGLAT